MSTEKELLERCKEYIQYWALETPEDAIGNCLLIDIQKAIHKLNTISKTNKDE